MTDRDRDPFRAFDERLASARGKSSERDEDEPRGPTDFGPGLQAGIEIFGGVVGGLLIGWGLDTWFGTTPVLLVVFFLLGGAAGVRNAFRTLKRLVPDEDEG